MNTAFDINQPALTTRFLLGVVRRPRTYASLLYLVLGIPLAFLYFLVLVGGFSTGLLTAPVLIGIPVLVITAALSWWLALFERQLAIQLLGVDIPPMARPPLPGASTWTRVKAHLSWPATWRSLGYLVVRVPAGFLSGIGVFFSLLLGLAMLMTPLAYLGGLGQGRDQQLMGMSVNGSFNPGDLVLTFLWSIGGAALILIVLHVGNGLAQVFSAFARVMLGARPDEMRAAEVRTQLAQAKAQAQVSDQRRRELIVSLSHELRNPLASVTAHLESLQMAGPPEVQPYLATALRETQRMTSLSDELLSLAQADSNELFIELTGVSVDGMIMEVEQALAPLASAGRSVSVVTDVPGGLVVRADRKRLAQVLMNLVRNAINHTPEGGLVSMSGARGATGWVDISVADTGPGIPAGELERIFERNFRGASAETAPSGYGLGLSIARQLVEAMGGRVRAESSEGRGSRFTVSLPVGP